MIVGLLLSLLYASLPPIKARATTDVITCEERPVRQRSPLLKDSSGRYRVVAEIVLRPNPGGENCRVIWNLRQAKAAGTWHSIEILDDEGNTLSEQELEILGFTPNNEKLVLRTRRSEGDSDLYLLVVVTLATERLRTYDLKDFLRGKREENCPVNLVPEGITAEGWVVVHPYSGEDLEPGQRPCIGETTWIYDPETKRRKLAPNPPLLKLSGTLSANR